MKVTQNSTTTKKKKKKKILPEGHNINVLVASMFLQGCEHTGDVLPLSLCGVWYYHPSERAQLDI